MLGSLSPTALFIVNPTAGGGRGHRAQARISALLRGSIEAEFAYTAHAGHGISLARDAAAAGVERIVAVGGDGTVHEVINGLLTHGTDGPRPRLGVIPIGTGNDFARSVGIPGGLEASLSAATGSGTRRVDVGRIGDRYFGVLAGTGFAARVAQAVNQAPAWSKIGALPFVYHTLREVVTNRNVELTVALDGGEPIRQPTFMVYVSNCRYSGGGMQLSPDAVPDDGLLDVCLVGDASLVDVVTMLPRVFSGAHVGHPRVSLHRARTVHVSGPTDVLVQADGEVIGTLPMEISIMPAGLEVVVLADA